MFLADTHHDIEGQVGHVVDNHASKEQEEQEVAQIQQSDTIINPRTVVIVARRVTITIRE